MKLQTGFAVSPANIGIAGGGRWARVLTKVVDDIVHPDVCITMYSPRNAASLSEWVRESGLKHKVGVSDSFPDSLPGTSNAIIVVNAARDHEKAVAWGLSVGAAVLVEKPVAETFEVAEKLATTASSLQLLFATAHVFLFAGYIDHFSDVVSKAGIISSVRVVWTDPCNEARYGEKKFFDASLPLFADWMPHILSILWRIIPGKQEDCELLQLTRGGAEIEVGMKIGNVPCHIVMARNSSARTRIVEVKTGAGKYKLDFSLEPGTITIGDAQINADPQWDNNEKPIAAMIRAFLKAAHGGPMDARLDNALGLQANKVIDDITPSYRNRQMNWIIAKLQAAIPDSDLDYAYTEILQASGPMPAPVIEDKIKKLNVFFSGNQLQQRIELLRQAKDFSEIERIGLQ